MTHTNGIAKVFGERKEEVHTTSVLQHARRRAADVAQHLSRRGAAAASAELCNEATNKLIALLYQPDTDGLWCNLDAYSGRFLVPAPWGSLGRPRYGLRRTEGDTLRRYVQFLASLDRPVRLFFFEGQQWHANIWDYPSVEKALGYWKLVQMDVATWKRFTIQGAS